MVYVAYIYRLLPFKMAIASSRKAPTLNTKLAAFMLGYFSFVQAAETPIYKKPHWPKDER